MKSFYLLLCFNQVDGFSIISKSFKYGIIYDNISSSTLYSDNNGYSNDEDSNRWISLDDSFDPDWESKLQKRQDVSLWSSFLPSKDDVFEEGIKGSSSISSSIDGLDDGEAWLDALASVAAEEINFIVEEADRADKLLQMQEWGFEPDTIRNTLNLAVDESLEIDEDNEVFEKFKKETAKTGFSMYLNDDEDLTTVESHTTVDVD